jgi:hypothetical protein
LRFSADNSLSAPSWCFSLNALARTTPLPGLLSVAQRQSANHTISQGSYYMERKPNITLSSLDLDRIESLLEKNNSQFPGRDALEAELDRADVLDPAEIPANVVTMNSTVRFTILEIAKTNTLTLVYPKDMDGSADKVPSLRR